MSAASQTTEGSAVANPAGTYVIVPFPANPQPPLFWLSLSDFISLFTIRQRSGQYGIQLNKGLQVDATSYNPATGVFAPFSFVINGKTCRFPDLTATLFNGITLLSGTVSGAGVTAKVRGIPNNLPIFTGEFDFTTSSQGYNGKLQIRSQGMDEDPTINLTQGTIVTSATDVSYDGVVLLFALRPPNTRSTVFQGFCLPRELAGRNLNAPIAASSQTLTPAAMGSGPPKRPVPVIPTITRQNKRNARGSFP